MQITVTQAPENRRRRKPDSGEKLGFGNLFSDHMFLMDYSQGTGWRDARIVPYGPLSLAPSAMVLHYGQEIFEGMKAYYARDGAICLFRPDRNAVRLNRSAARMCLPEIPVEDQLAALRALVRLDREWIPRGEGASLYIRPAMIGIEEGLGVRPSADVLFFIITGPVGAYYARGFDPVRILVEEKFVRAARGGLGEAKTGANYAASLLAAKNAKALGFDQVLWLDAEHRSFVEEVGTMNIFFVLRGELVTPPPFRLDPARGDAGHRPRTRAGVEDPGGGAPRGDRRGPFGGRGRYALRGVRLRDGGGHLPGRLLLLPRAGGRRERGEGGGTRRPVLPGDHRGPVRGDRGPPPLDPPGGVRGDAINRGRPSRPRG